MEKLCDPGLMDVRDRHFSRLESLYSGQPLDNPFFLNGIAGYSHTNLYKEPERWVHESLDLLADLSEKAMDPVVFRPLILQTNPYGVHFIDRIFGAHVYRAENQWWVDYLETPIGELEYPDLDKSDTWLLAQRLAKAFLDSRVTVPLLSLPVLSSVLNIGVNLYGEELIVSMLTKPEAAQHDLQIINDVICELHRWYLANIPMHQLQPVSAARRCQPQGFGQLCGCTCHLLPLDMYREFVAPLDDKLLSTYPNGGMIHLCGAHAQHIPIWREMKSLRAIQTTDRASEDLETYFTQLRKDQVIYLNPTNTVTVERAMSITNGKRIVFIGETPNDDALI